jgi:hypothetical protein
MFTYTCLKVFIFKKYKNTNLIIAKKYNYIIESAIIDKFANYLLLKAYFANSK